MTKKLRRLFPKLFGGQYRVTSARTKEYNCLAWAAGRTDEWWEARTVGIWPPGVRRDGSVSAAVELFLLEDFSCTHLGDVALEPGVIKLAIYGDDGYYTHTARQLPSGKWTSKIGKLEDIEHDSLDALTSVAKWIGTRADLAYGSVQQMMRK